MCGACTPGEFCCLFSVVCCLLVPVCLLSVVCCLRPERSNKKSQGWVLHWRGLGDVTRLGRVACVGNTLFFVRFNEPVGGRVRCFDARTNNDVVAGSNQPLLHTCAPRVGVLDASL